MAATTNHRIRASVATYNSGSPVAIGSFSAVTELMSSTVSKQRTIVDTQGLAGTASHYAARVREGLLPVAGQISFYLCPDIFETMLPYMGVSESTNVWTVTETVTAFDLLIDRVVKREVFRGLKCSQWTMSGSPGQPIVMTMDLLGLTADAFSDTAFPSIAQADDAPYMFHDNTSAEFNGEEREINSFSLTCSRQAMPAYRQSQSATEIIVMDRIVTLSTSIPYNTDEIDLLTHDIAAGAAATLEFTQGSNSVTIDIASWHPEVGTPPIPNMRGEQTIELSGMCRRTSGNAELIITNIVA